MTDITKVTVDLEGESLYAEPDSLAYRVKRKLTYGTILSLVGKFVRDKRKFAVLEIGTGSGFFVRFLEEAFPEANITGLEYDPRLVDLTQRKAARSRIVRGNAETFSFPGQVFDLVVSLQVIEHLYHPELMLQAVHSHLAPGGRLILTTPNLGCLSARVLKERWHGYRDDHVSLKNRSEWVEFVEAHGFRTLYSGSTFFSGIPLLNRLPFGIVNWGLLLVVGSLRWGQGESFIGVFERVTID